jgi:two-component system, OmpR family, sensor histidine kinase MprB
MPLRRRVGMVAAVSVGVAVILVAAVAYFVVRHQLRSQVDNALRAQAGMVQHNITSLSNTLPGIPASAGGPAPYVQAVAADGTAYPIQGKLRLPVNSDVTSVAAGGGYYMTDIHVGDSHLRELTFKILFMYHGQPLAIQLARPLGYVDHTLSNLRLILLLLIAGGVALAAVLGRVAARRVLAPLAEVAGTAQHISETEDLGARIQVRADDEVGQLATRFNTMLERLQSSRSALDESVQAQRQLVADASHELRTPVTSLRTNIELLLADEHQLSEGERRRMLADVVEQSEELSALVGDLIELARGDLPAESAEEVELAQIVAASVERARRNFPEITFQADLTPTTVNGVPERLGRAVNNLLDNAARHSPPSGVVEVVVGPEGVSVRDHGSGIDPADLPYVFDRFFRGAGARGRQGSGLGLAIVRQVAAQHGGSVTAGNAPDGGAVFTLALPVLAREDEDRLGRGGASDPSLSRGPEALA